MATKVIELVNNGSYVVEKKYGMTYKEFAKKHLFACQPVVIGDACKDWAAKDKFTPEFFKNEYGSRDVVVEGQRFKLEEYIDLMKTSTIENPAPYPCKLQIDKDYPELIPDILPRFQFALPDWTHSNMIKPFVRHVDTHEVFLGSPGGQFPYVHYDYMGFHAFITQLYGIKEFTVIPPEQTPYVYPKENNSWVSEIPDIKNIDSVKYPLSTNLTPITFTVGPGETLFIPNGWWHTARSLNMTISVALDSLNASNWGRFQKEVKAKVSKRNSLIAKMVDVYLSVIGGAFKIVKAKV
ncbi:cupin-like domain-containing protein [Maribacter sp. 2304DJ31-5]|uniref:cupin-like domain-containing protein n=1 Tax=Maribacter sp. 2304DJ31-5 TaxID=3386273 RepID=UPI0039BD4304